MISLALKGGINDRDRRRTPIRIKADRTKVGNNKGLPCDQRYSSAHFSLHYPGHNRLGHGIAQRALGLDHARRNRAIGKPEDFGAIGRCKLHRRRARNSKAGDRS